MPSPEKIMDVLGQKQAPETETLLNAPPSENETDHLKKLLLTRGDLDKVKTNLDTMIDVMAENPSLFSRASKYWGTTSLWLKILVGVVIIVPTLAVGIILNIHLVIAVSIFSLISYVATSLILDNHHGHMSDTTAGLKKGISGLAETLGAIIQALDTIHQQLSSLVDEFRQENETLSSNIEKLNQEVDLLKTQVERLGNTVSELEQTKEDLGATAAHLDNSVRTNIELLEKSQQQLAQIQSNYELDKLEFSEKITQLTQEKAELNKEYTKVKQISITLQTTVETLVSSALADEGERKAFQEKLSTFLKNKEETFDKIGTNLELSVSEIKAVKEELNHLVEHYRSLIKEQEQLITKLNDAMAKAKTNSAAGSVNDSPSNLFGLFKMQNAGHKSSEHLPSENKFGAPLSGRPH